MLRLFLLITAIFLVCIAALSAVVFIGQHQPIPERIAALHLADCQPPCWMGITLGQTPDKIARQRFSEAFPTQVYNVSITPDTEPAIHYSASKRMGESRASNSDIFVTLDGSNGILETLFIGVDTPNQYMPSLYEVISAFGPPECALITDGGPPFLTLIYADSDHYEILSVEVRDPGLDWTLPVYSVSMYRLQINDPNLKACQPFPGTFQWQGLGKLKPNQGNVAWP